MPSTIGARATDIVAGHAGMRPGDRVRIRWQADAGKPKQGSRTGEAEE